MASVNLEVVRNAKTVCMGAIQDLNSLAEKLKNRYQQAGQRWKDKKYEQLGSIVNECTSALRQPIDALFDSVKTLEGFEKALQEYDDTNLG